MELRVVPLARQPLTVHCDSGGAVAQSKVPRSPKSQKYIPRKYHLVKEIVQRGDIAITKIASANNLANPFTKTLIAKVFERHVYRKGHEMQPGLALSPSGRLLDFMVLI